MKKLLLLSLLLVSMSAGAQTVFGYWYGFAAPKTAGTTSNYLVELVLKPEPGYVSGILSYYFKDTYRSLAVKGNYDAPRRVLTLYNVPIAFHGSSSSLEIDCIMNFRGNLRVAKAGSNLVGSFTSVPETQYTCTEMGFNLALNADVSKQDSVLKAIREFKESNQVWKPGLRDTVTSVRIIQRKVVNYFVENQYKQRTKAVAREIAVSSPKIQVDFYDNGEIDGDSISVFFNDQLMAYSQRLGTGAIHFDLELDSSKSVNEITMFADNLGSIAPNTALMVVTDGEQQYQVRLSSNLEKSATIRITRSVQP